ncbi:hypothetical protein P4H82_27540 [Bacillus cereus]|nr:hypothetical protein [Bacillus cereus]MEB9190462.1 hypothetical protein [Bacillus cereus]
MTGYVNYCIFKKKYDLHVICLGEEVESFSNLSHKEMKEITSDKPHVMWVYPEEFGNSSY